LIKPLTFFFGAISFPLFLGFVLKN